MTRGERAGPSAKDEIAALLRRLPDDCSFEDVQYHLYVLAKVREGLAAADREDVLDEAEVDARLSRWTDG